MARKEVLVLRLRNESVEVSLAEVAELADGLMRRLDNSSRCAGLTLRELIGGQRLSHAVLPGTHAVALLEAIDIWFGRDLSTRRGIAALRRMLAAAEAQHGSWDGVRLAAYLHGLD